MPTPITSKKNGSAVLDASFFASEQLSSSNSDFYQQMTPRIDETSLKELSRMIYFSTKINFLFGRSAVELNSPWTRVTTTLRLNLGLTRRDDGCEQKSVLPEDVSVSTVFWPFFSSSSATNWRSCRSSCIHRRPGVAHSKDSSSSIRNRSSSFFGSIKEHRTGDPMVGVETSDDA